MITRPTPCSVWRTNADLEQIQLMDKFANRDLAETAARKLFVQNGTLVDFAIADSSNHMMGAFFSDRTMRLRGECQG